MNSQLIMAFVRQASAEGIKPLVVYFPSRGDLSGDDRSEKAKVLAVLRQGGVPAIDLTSCIAALGTERAFNPGRPHYTPEGNAAVARCLLPTVQSLIARG